MSINPKLLKAFESWSRSDLNLILLKKAEVPLTSEAKRQEKARLITEAKALFAEHAPTAPLRATIEAILASKHTPAKAAEAKPPPALAAEVVRKEKKAVQKPPAKEMSDEECLKTALKLTPFRFTCDLEYLNRLDDDGQIIEWLSNIPAFLKTDLKWVADEMAFQGLDEYCDNFEDVLETEKMYIQLASIAAIFVWIIPDCGVLVLTQIAMRAAWFSSLKLYRKQEIDLATIADGDEEGEDFAIEFITEIEPRLDYGFRSKPSAPNGKELLAKMSKVAPSIPKDSKKC